MAWTSRASSSRARSSSSSSEPGRAAGCGRGGQRRADFRGRERRDLDDLELRRRVAQQAMGPRGVAGREHEPVAARPQRPDEIAQHAAQAREALERPQLEELVEQERRGRVSGDAGRVEECQRCVEGRARAGVLAVVGRSRTARERRRLTHRGEEPLRRRRDPLDVDVLRRRAAEEIAQPQEERGPPRAAAAEDDRDARTASGRSVKRRQDSPLERRPLRNHHRPDPP